MKHAALILLFATTILANAQNFVSLANDKQGDSFHIDAKELSYFLNTAEDSLFIKIEHYNSRTPSYGFILALDTNLNPNDGFSLLQNNMFNLAANLSMNYDLALYAYEFSNFPGLIVEAYASNGSLTQVPFGFDTSNAFYSIFSIPLSSIGGNADLNMVAFTGSFSISPGGSGPSDALPDDTFVELRASSISLKEQKTRSFSVYPNPAKDMISIEVIGDPKSFCLMDFNGKIIREIKNINTASISIEGLPKGIYFLKTEKAIEAMKIAIY